MMILLGFAAGKMRLGTGGQRDLGDNNTLAYYNLLNGTVMELGLKGR